MGEGFIDRYSVQPGIETGIFSELLKTIPGFYEYILEYIVSIFMCDDDSSDLPI